MSPESMAGTLWQGVLSQIRGRISEQQFDTWFRGVQPGTCSEDVLELTVPNSFSREWLRKKYADVILGAVEKANGGRRPTLRIVVREGGGAAGGCEVVADPAVATGVSVSDPEMSAVGAGLEEDRPEAGSAAWPHPRLSSSDVRQPGISRARAEGPGGATLLNRELRFKTFVAGPNARLAHAAAMTVVEKDGRVYNPLYVHGGVGLGKTHLLQAICHAFAERRPELKVHFVPCEHFINHFITSVDRGDIDAFRTRYREVDVLVMDDVHLLADKERTQEEFLHTFNALHARGRQIVLAAGRAPGDIEGLSERLASRLKGGLVCEIEAPGFDTRLEIVRRRAERSGVSVPEEVVRFVAENVRTNVRELEGALTRVVGYGALLSSEVTLDVARDALRDVVVERRRRVTLDHIAKAVSVHYGIRLAEMQSRRRTQAIANPRQVCMFLARRLTGHSLEEVGAYFGGRDHSTVLYGVEKISERAGEDPAFRDTLEQLAAEALTLAAS